MNSIEFLIGNLLNEIGMKWDYEKIYTFGKVTYLPDFYIEHNNKKIIIECFGDYWHGNPLYYKGDDRFTKKKTFIDIWNKDENKKNKFIENGFVYLTFWENDIINNIDNIKKQIIYAINN